MVSAAPAEHDSVGRLLESRCAAATSEVYEALRERACRSIEDADVIERKGLAGFAAPFDSYLGVAVHDKLGNSHSLLYSQSGRFGGKSTGVLPGLGPGLCHDVVHIQRFPTAHAELSKGRLRRFARRYSAFLSDYLPDVPLQADDVITVAGECPQDVRVLEGASDANKPSEPKSKREVSLRLSAESPSLTKLLRCVTRETLAAAVANDIAGVVAGLFSRKRGVLPRCELAVPIDLDLERRLLFVRQSAWRGKLGDPKTETSIRVVELSAQACEHLSQFLKCWRPNERRLLFATKNGSPWDANLLLKRKFKPLLAKLVIRIPSGNGFHAFRHANATMMDRLGTPLKIRQERLGHSDSRITQTIYTHVVSEDSRRVAAQLGEAVWGILDASGRKNENGSGVEPPSRLESTENWLRGSDLN